MRSNVTELHEDGFTRLNRVFMPRSLLALNYAVQSYIEITAPTVPPNDAMFENGAIKRLGEMDKHSLYFKGLLNDMAYDAERLLECPVVGQTVQLFNKAPGNSTATPAHQEAFYNPLKHVINGNEHRMGDGSQQFGTTGNLGIVLWISLGDVSERDGCLRYVPRSHKKGLRPHRPSGVFGFSQGIELTPEDLKDEIPAPTGAGDVLAHQWLTIHRAEPNMGVASRMGLSLIYWAKDAVLDVEAQKTYREELEKIRVGAIA